MDQSILGPDGGSSELEYVREVAFMAKVKARHEVNNHHIWTCFLHYRMGRCEDSADWPAKATQLAAHLQVTDRQLHKDFKRYWRRTAPRYRTPMATAQPMTRVADFADYCMKSSTSYQSQLVCQMEHFLEDLISLEQIQDFVHNLCYIHSLDVPNLHTFFMNQFVAQ